ncbi:MAG TPA: hypothetical protein VHT95_13985 [Vicinamibacterales bacterium]|nr:hypothetical protein [Vicinamibacterales bacterium]
MTLRLLALSSLMLSAAVGGAQTERVTVRMAPAPNQTLHQRTTQDTELTTETEAGAGSDKPIPAMAMSMRAVVDTTSAVGPTDHDGHYSARVTIDAITATATMNGREMPVPSQVTAAATQVITFSYDENDKVIDVSTGDSAGAAIDAAKQILMRAFATVAPMTLSVGESVTLPTAVNLPMPSGGAAVPMGIAGETRYTLISVTFDGADRIAHLASHTTSRITQAPAAPGSPFGFDMTMMGDGKSDVNVDRGIVLHAEQRSTIEGTLHAGSAGMAMPNMRTHGTFATVSDLVK